MKLFYATVFLVFFFTKTATAQEWQVPDVGSRWESTTVYTAANDGSPSRRKIEVTRVDRLMDGRPVFAGKIFGIDGEIVESSAGTIVYADECKRDVPKEQLAPPVTPNQCVWHVCYAPPVGQMFIRQMIIHAPLFACQPQLAVYTFKSIRMGVHNGAVITVGRASITLNGIPRASWESHIKEGEGEVFAEYPGSVTTYDKVSVTRIPYRASDAK